VTYTVLKVNDELNIFTTVAFSNKLHHKQSKTIDSHTILRYFGVCGHFLDISLLLVQNLMSHSCLATPTSYKCDEISRTSRLILRADVGQMTDATTVTEGSYTSQIIQIIYYTSRLHWHAEAKIFTHSLKENIECLRPSESSRSAGQPCSQKVSESPFVYLYAIAQCQPSSQHWHKSLCHSAPPPVSEATQIHATLSFYYTLNSYCPFTGRSS